MSQSDAFRILDAAWALGVRAFDTAEAYGASAAMLRAWTDSRSNAHEVEVVTKCKVDALASPQEVEEAADAALSRFDGMRHLTLLSHGPVGADKWPALLSAAGRHDATVGQSVYSPEEVSAACELPGIGRLQAPGNILDQRAIAARGNTSVCLDIRSIYLQGVLLERPDDADVRAPGASPVAAALQARAAALHTELAPLLVASMLRVIGERDRLVLGVDEMSQLGAFPAALGIPEGTVRQFMEEVAPLSDDPATVGILDPRTWPAQPSAGQAGPTQAAR